MKNEVYFGTIDKKDIYSIYIENEIINIEKMNYNSYHSTTNSHVKIYGDYYGQEKIINSQTNTNSVTHFKTKIFLDDNSVLEFDEDLNVLEGWHIRQNYIVIGDNEKLIDSIIVESGYYLYNSGFTASKIIQNAFIPYKAIYRNPSTYESLLLWAATPCFHYLINKAIPKLLLISIPNMLNTNLFYFWIIITALITIFEIVNNRKQKKASLKIFRQETEEYEKINQSIKQQYTEFLEPVENMHDNFMNYGFDGIEQFITGRND